MWQSHGPKESLWSTVVGLRAGGIPTGKPVESWHSVRGNAGLHSAVFRNDLPMPKKELPKCYDLIPWFSWDKKPLRRGQYNGMSIIGIKTTWIPVKERLGCRYNYCLSIAHVITDLCMSSFTITLSVMSPHHSVLEAPCNCTIIRVNPRELLLSTCQGCIVHGAQAEPATICL